MYGEFIYSCHRYFGHCYLFCSNLLLKNYFIKEIKHSNRVCMGLCKPWWVWEKSRAGTNTRPSVSCLYYLLSISPKRTSVCISLCKHGYCVSFLKCVSIDLLWQVPPLPRPHESLSLDNKHSLSHNLLLIPGGILIHSSFLPHY